jgi:citrate lyase subunit beta/citryl-CoA lyase
MLMRSKLFVPASRPELFAKAEVSAADALSFDLEDAVAESRKEDARATLADYLKSRKANGKTIVVRVNAAGTPWFEADVAAVGDRADVINLPMVESPDAIVELAQRLDRGPAAARIMVNIETPAALRQAAALAAAHERVSSLQIGYADLLEPYGIDRRDEGALSHIRMTVRLAAAERGIAAYDGAFAGVGDGDYFARECAQARAQGFAGKSCIHPSQIAAANQAFLPTEREAAQARKILAAAQEAEAKGIGAYLVDGQMIDKPFLTRARAIVALLDSARTP